MAGILSTETPASLTLEAPGGEWQKIVRAAITERSTAGMSAMPIDLHRQLSVEQRAGLLAFRRGG